MIFQPEHIEKNKTGIKTETRRRWDKGMAYVGRYYPCMRDYRHKHDPEDGWILVNKVFRQRLGDMSQEDAKAEGGYTLAEYIKVWIRINGGWNANEIVTVVKYKWVRYKIAVNS